MLKMSFSSTFRRSSLSILSASKNNFLIVRHLRNSSELKSPDVAAAAASTVPLMGQAKDIVSCAKEDHGIIRHLGERFNKERDNNEKQKIANTFIREGWYLFPYNL